jgi:hypothetical protein
MIHREEARLRSLFHRLLVLSAAASPAACSTVGNADASDASLAPDTTQSGTSNPTVDSGGTQPLGSDAGTSGGGFDATLPSEASITDAAVLPPIDALDPFGFLDSACDPQYLPDAGDAGDGGGCDFFEYLPCGLPPNTPTEVCALLVSQCGYLCSFDPTENRTCAVAIVRPETPAVVPESVVAREVSRRPFPPARSMRWGGRSRRWPTSRLRRCKPSGVSLWSSPVGGPHVRSFGRRSEQRGTKSATHARPELLHAGGEQRRPRW